MLTVVTGDLGIDTEPGKDRVLLLRMLSCCWRGMTVALTGGVWPLVLWPCHTEKQGGSRSVASCSGTPGAWADQAWNSRDL